MGLIRPGPPEELILELKDRYQVREFIECGTSTGNTAAWAAAHFAHVSTVEYAREIYEQTAARYRHLTNVDFVYGDSRSALKRLVPSLDGPAMFWLDSHWSGANTYGENDECPLLDEIRTINGSTTTHFLFIDDARMFMAPPPEPHRVEQWPPIDTVIAELKSTRYAYYIVIVDDVIVAVPEAARPVVARYCQRLSTRDWAEHMQAINISPASKGLTLIGQGLKLLANGVWSRRRT